MLDWTTLSTFMFALHQSNLNLISFFYFQAMSYLIGLPYKEKTPWSKLFPQANPKGMLVNYYVFNLFERLGMYI